MTGTTGLFVSAAGAGVIAGGTSCAAAQLGLLVGAVKDDRKPVAPLAAFLTAKLVSHTVLGGVLGTVGATVQPGPRVRALLLGAAALLLLRYALDLLGLPLAGHLSLAGHLPRALRQSRHSSGTAGVRDRAGCGPVREPGCEATWEPVREAPARSATTGAAVRPGGRRILLRPGLLRPGLLGVSTVLVPCGLTLSAELLAVTSRSALGGAAVMAGFVAGTAPSFGLLGFALGRGALSLRGLPATLVAACLIGVAGWTVLSGLRLGGWLPAEEAAAAVDRRFVQVTGTGTQTITVWALDRGYRPARVTARPGMRTILVLRTRNTTGCTRAFVIPSRTMERILPTDGTTRIDLGIPAAGRLRFVCASGHYPGGIDFRSAPAARSSPTPAPASPTPSP